MTYHSSNPHELETYFHPSSQLLNLYLLLVNKNASDGILTIARLSGQYQVFLTIPSPTVGGDSLHLELSASVRVSTLASFEYDSWALYVCLKVADV